SGLPSRNCGGTGAHRKPRDPDQSQGRRGLSTGGNRPGDPDRGVTMTSVTIEPEERIGKPRRRRIRRSVVGLLVALSCLLVLLSTTEVWAHRTLLNTPTFVGTVAPVINDPAVTSAVAVRA